MIIIITVALSSPCPLLSLTAKATTNSLVTPHGPGDRSWWWWLVVVEEDNEGTVGSSKDPNCCDMWL
jgi:hypothetical protein